MKKILALLLIGIIMASGIKSFAYTENEYVWICVEFERPNKQSFRIWGKAHEDDFDEALREKNIKFLKIKDSFFFNNVTNKFMKLSEYSVDGENLGFSTTVFVRLSNIKGYILLQKDFEKKLLSVKKSTK